MSRKREGAADGIVAPTCSRSAHLLNTSHGQDRCFFLRCYRNPNQGDNVLLFKVVNDFGEWKGCARLVDDAGRPAQGIRVKLNP